MMRILKNKLVQMVLPVMTLVGLAVMAAPTPAYAAFSNCPGGTMCTWMDADGGGAMAYWPFSTSGAGSGVCQTLPSNWQNDITSTEVLYGSGWGVHWYSRSSCDGTWDQFQRTQTTANWGGTVGNNNWMSFRISKS